MEFGTNHWAYTGDVNLEYGGTFAKLDPSDLRYGYASVVEVTDLDSAAGAGGMVLIEAGTVSITRERVRTAMDSCGWFPIGREAWGKIPRPQRKAMMLGALRGYYGMDVDESEIVQTDPTQPFVNDGWKATKHIDPSDLPGYVARKFLD